MCLRLYAYLRLKSCLSVSFILPLVIIAIDPSVKVTSGISKEKSMEICHWMLSELQSYAARNGYHLYISRQVGGITNRQLSFDKYFGRKIAPLTPPTKIGSYGLASAKKFVLPNELAL